MSSPGYIPVGLIPCALCPKPAVLTVYGVPGAVRYYCEEHQPESTRLTVMPAARAAVVCDALALVAQVAEREPVVYDLYGISRACAFCRREQWSKHVLEHADSCLWLACRRLAERAAVLGERTPQSTPDAITATESAKGSE